MISLLQRVIAQWKGRSARAAAGVVWYLECRRLAGDITEREPQAMGSAVMIKLEHLRREAVESQARWIPHEPPRIERYLLTCAHVVTDTQGDPARAFDEILAWQPGRTFLRWPSDAAPRPAGKGIESLGACPVRVVLGPTMLPGGALLRPSRAYSDWMLLAFDEGSPSHVGASPALEQWLDFDPHDIDVSIVGYPGGSLGWGTEHKVEARVVGGFRLERQDDAEGHVVLAGADETRPGMSGGGVFVHQHALAGVHRAALDAGMERHSVAGNGILTWLAERGLRPPPAPASHGKRALRLVGASLLLAMLAAGGMSIAFLLEEAPVASLCVQAHIGERALDRDGKSLLQLPLAGLQLGLKGDWMKTPVYAVLTDGDGKTCFPAVRLEREDGARAYPFRIHVVNTPGVMQEYAPLMVSPHGVEADGRRRHADPDLVHFVNTAVPIPLHVIGQATVQASQLSGAVIQQGDNGSPQNLVDAISSAAQRKALAPEARDRAVSAWATILQNARPVLAASTWSERTSGTHAGAVAAVGAYFEDGQLRSTGFVLDRHSIVVPAFAVDHSAKRRWMIFNERPGSSGPADRVELGTVRLGDLGLDDEHAMRKIAVIRARGPLPPAPALSSLNMRAGSANRDIAVIGYPARDARTPVPFQEAFSSAYGRRSAMLGQAWLAADPGKNTYRIEHDATTTGGTGGSAVVDVASGAIVGMHLGGSFDQSLYKTNFAVAMPDILAQSGLQPGNLTAPAPPDSSSAGDPLQIGSAQPRVAGYSRTFLGFQLPPPQLAQAGGSGQAAPLLDYLHYSVAMHTERRMALFAAANVDRSFATRVPREVDLWVSDPRIAPDAQPDKEFFKANDIDRGHLISRTAVAWGTPDIADLAARSAFYLPNATPQHSKLNQGAWSRLEHKVYSQLQPGSKRISIFAGPVHEAADWLYRGRRIPRRFWMVAVFDAPAGRGKPAVHAFMVEQYEAGVLSEGEPVWTSNSAKEVGIADVEQATGLRFPAVLHR